MLKANADKCRLLGISSEAINFRVSKHDIKKVNVRNYQVSNLTVGKHLKNVSLMFIEKLAGKLMHLQESLRT